MAQMKRKTTIILVALAVVFCGWYFEDFFLTAGYAPGNQFASSPPTMSETQTTLIKDADSTGKSLLLKASDHSQFFLYDPSKQIIRNATSEEWEMSSEKELDCWEQSTPDDYSGISYGHYLLTAKKSPDSTKIAILSAYGPRTPEILSFPGLGGGGGRIWGTRYLEIKSFPEYEPIGKPIRIDLPPHITPSLCWSDGLKHIVVHTQGDNFGYKFSVVDNPAN